MIIGFCYKEVLVEFSPKLVGDGLGVKSLLRFLPILEKYRGLPFSYLIKYSFELLSVDHVLIFEQKAWLLS